MSTKLVRDAIREAPGFIPCGSDRFRQVHNREEHISLLRQKILEELAELMGAVGDGICLESADLIDAVLSYAYIDSGYSEADVMVALRTKRLQRGGFLGGLVWEHP